MNKCLYNGVDIFNPLNGKIQHFIDAFTQVYGEQYRQVINSRLSSAKYFFLGGNFDELIKIYKEKQIQEIKALNTHNISISLKKVKAKQIQERYSIIINVFKQCLNNQAAINNKYKTSISNLLQTKIQYTRKVNNLELLTKETLNSLDGIYLNLLCQGKKEFLENSKNFTDQEKNKYQNFFAVLGYKTNSFYESISNKKLLNNIFDTYLITKMNNLQKLKNEELNKTNIFTTDFKKKFNDLQIYGDKEDKEDYLTLANQYIQGKMNAAAYVISCLSYKTGYTNLCFCNNALSLSLLELTHEMGHIIDSFVVETNKYGYYYKCGFELFFNSYNNYAYIKTGIPHENSKKYRQAMLFDEMVNEYITLQVSKIIEEKNINVALKPKSKNTINLYQFGFEIFEDFLRKYKNHLIYLKLQNDKNDKTYEFFGKKNFDEICILAKEYITKRNLLNKEWLKGKDVENQIDILKTKSKAKLKSIELKMEKNIEKFYNKLNKQKELSNKDIEIQTK